MARVEVVGAQLVGVDVLLFFVTFSPLSPEIGYESSRGSRALGVVVVRGVDDDDVVVVDCAVALGGNPIGDDSIADLGVRRNAVGGAVDDHGVAVAAVDGHRRPAVHLQPGLESRIHVVNTGTAGIGYQLKLVKQALD